MAIIPGYYTVEEARRVIGVSHSQVTRYISGGLLRALRLGHQMLIKQSEVERFKRPLRGNPNLRRRKRRTA